MTKLLRNVALILGAIAALVAGTVRAAGMSPDPTGMWYDPAQPGWGLGLSQQGDTVFAVLFVYGVDHDPQWFVASNVVDTGRPVSTLVGEAFAGSLYRTTGPYFASPADPASLGVTPVGTIQLAYIQASGNLSVSYTINGTNVSKTLVPQTWRSNAGNLSGIYFGAMLFNGTQECSPPPAMLNATVFGLGQGVAPDTITISWNTDTNPDNPVIQDDTKCSVAGTYSQRGQLGSLVGSVLCGPIAGNNFTLVGGISITQLSITPTGFSGYINFTQANGNSQCTVPGTIGGVKRLQ